MNFRYELLKLSHELEAESNAAHDLWTWLPSYKSAQKVHNMNFIQNLGYTVENVLIEACELFSYIKGYDLTATKKENFSCPCGCGVIDEDYLKEFKNV